MIRDSAETAGSFFVIEMDTGYIASYVHFIPDGNNNAELGFIDISETGNVQMRFKFKNDSLYQFSPWHQQVSQTSTGTYLMSNTVRHLSTGESVGNFLVFDENFSPLKDTIFVDADQKNEQLWGQALVNDSTLIAVGSSSELIDLPLEGDFSISKFDASGRLIKSIVSSDTLFQLYRGIKYDSTANCLYAFGLKHTPRGSPGWDSQYWITKFDTALNEIWHLSVPEECDEGSFADMTLGPDGNLFLAAGTCVDPPFFDLTLFKITPQGNIEWKKKLDYEYYGQQAKKIFYHQNHFYVLSHTFREEMINDTLKGQHYAGFFKLSLSGDILWKRLIAYSKENSSNNELEDIIPTSDGGFMGVGQFKRSLQQPSAWVVKLNSEGCFDHEECIDYTSVPTVEEPVQEPKVFPNPFKNELNFEIKNCKSIAIYNNHGQRVYNQPRLKSINTSNWAPGLYVYYATLNSGQVIQGKCIKY